MTTSITTAAQAEREADQLRRDLTTTLDLLLDNLTPQHLASEAFDATRHRIARSRPPRWIRRSSAFALGPIGLGAVGAVAASVVVGLLTRRR